MKHTTIDSYIEEFSGDTKLRLTELRNLILQMAPGATESISYGMPAFKINKKALIYFAGYPEHIGMYPGRVESYDFDQRLQAYASGKSTLRFPHTEPLPIDLIKELLKYRLAQASEGK